MTDGTSIDIHNNSLTYVETEVDFSAERPFKVAWAVDGRTVTVSGSCPACGGRTSTEFSPGIGSSKGFRKSEQWSQAALPSSLTLFCECGHAHADRPLEALDKGCGRFWLVLISDDARRPLSGATTNSPDTHDVQAAQ